MITLTRLTGAVFALNPDLVERVDQNPDTVITLVDGTKYLVRESMEGVIGLMRDYRASVLAAAGLFEGSAGSQVTEERRLSAVPRDGEAPVIKLQREEH
jgi:flagellar protein FlbD